MAGFRPYFIFSGTLKLALPLGMLAMLAGWAQPFIPLDGFKYRDNTLKLSTQASFPQPQWETWQSLVDGQPTRMLVVDLPDVTGNLPLLKAQLREIEQNSPRFSRLVLLPMTSGNLRLVVELSVTRGELLMPRVERLSDREIAIFLDSAPEPQEMKHPTPVPVPETARTVTAKATTIHKNESKFDAKHDTDVLRSELARANQSLADITRELNRVRQENNVLVSNLDELRKKAPASTAKTLTPGTQAEMPDPSRMSAFEQEKATLQGSYAKLKDKHEALRTHLQVSLEENIRLQRKLESVKGGKNTPSPDAGPSKVLELMGKLQAVIDERDDLQQQVQDLQRIMAEQDNTISELRHELSQQTDIIRNADPSLAPINITDPQVNANLRSALLRVSVRLKEAEEELARIKSGQPAEKPQTPVVNKSHQPESKGIIIADGKSLTIDRNNIEVKIDPTVADRKLEEGLRQQIQANPTAMEPYLQLNSHYQTQRNYAAAASVLQELLSKNPRYSAAYYELARVYTMQQRLQQAQVVLETYRRLSPRDTQRIAALETMIQSQLDKERRP